ncbi:MAG: formyltransferase family protein [Candidatus Beckwithbacteria bacterium]|nr:formyltransferase family protein [Candidatus Beckwithbacteria bacterium]
MPPISILFLGNNTGYSNQVKTALEAAGYPLVSNQKQADLIISAAYGQKLPPGGLNLHPSLLPAYRGATPVPYQILNNETKSGISIIKMTDQFDAGPIVAQEPVPILPDDTSLDLLKRCFTAGAKLLVKILPDYLNNKITLKPQPNQSPTPYCRRFTKQDGFITWEEFKKGADERKIRALYPWPGVWTKIPNNKILKLLPKNLLQLEGKQPITRKQFEAGYGHLL